MGGFCSFTLIMSLIFLPSLLKTMLNRAFKLSSNWKLFHQECERLKETFARLQYPESLVETTIRQFVEAKVVTGNACPQQQQAPSQQEVPIRVVLPYKDQKAANSVRRQLSDLSRKINTEIRPVYTSRKIKDIKGLLRELKHSAVPSRPGTLLLLYDLLGPLFLVVFSKVI